MGKLLRAKEAMAKLGIKKSKFYDDIRAEKIPKPVRQGGVTGYPEDEIDAVIEQLKADRDRNGAVPAQPLDPPDDTDEDDGPPQR